MPFCDDNETMSAMRETETYPALQGAADVVSIKAFSRAVVDLFMLKSERPTIVDSIALSINKTGQIAEKVISDTK